MVFFLANSRGTNPQPIVTPTIIVPTSIPTATQPPPTTVVPTQIATDAPTQLIPTTVVPTLIATDAPTQLIPTTVVPTLTATDSPTPNTPVQIGMTLDPICYNITVDMDHLLQHEPDEYDKHLPSILSDLRKVLPNDGSVRVGMVLVWGHSEEEFTDGVKMAKHVMDVIKRDFPNSFGAAARKSLFSDGIEGGPGTVQIEMYLFSNSEWKKNGLEVDCWS